MEFHMKSIMDTIGIIRRAEYVNRRYHRGAICEEQVISVVNAKNRYWSIIGKGRMKIKNSKNTEMR